MYQYYVRTEGRFFMAVVMVIVAASLRLTNHDAVPYVRWQYCTTSQTLLAVQNIYKTQIYSIHLMKHYFLCLLVTKMWQFSCCMLVRVTYLKGFDGRLSSISRVATIFRISEFMTFSFMTIHVQNWQYSWLSEGYVLVPQWVKGRALVGSRGQSPQKLWEPWILQYQIEAKIPLFRCIITCVYMNSIHGQIIFSKIAT